MTGRGRRVPRGAVQVLVLAVAAVLTVALAETTVVAGFVATSGSTGNQVSAAAQFCATPSSATSVATADTFVDQGDQSNSTHGDDAYLVVTPQAGAARRMYLRFDLPPVPSRCVVSGATLEVFAES